MTIKRSGANLSSGRGAYSSTFGEGLACKQSSIERGWKWKTLSRTSLASSVCGLSRSTQRKRLVSANSVGIRAISKFRLCNRPWVVNASERIIGSLLSLRTGGAFRVRLSFLPLWASAPDVRDYRGLYSRVVYRSEEKRQKRQAYSKAPQYCTFFEF